MSVTVRGAEIRDLEWMLGQMREFSDSMQTRHKLFELTITKNFMIRAIKDHVVLVAETTEGATSLAGFIAGVVTPHLMNPQVKVLAEMFWWVPKSLRGGLAASRLLDEFVRIGKEVVKADWITFGLMTMTDVNENGLIRRGFKSFERAYLLEV